jgi:hypothetical protein
MTMDEAAALPSDAVPGEGEARSGLRLPVWAWLCLWMGVWVGGSATLHYAIHGVVNGWQLALAIFLSINILICVWEIALYFQIDTIEAWHHEPRHTSGRPRGSLFTSEATLRDLASTRLWARVWSEYARYDPSYADRKSFGFAIDVGNGFSTLIPSLVFFFAMTVPLLPARVVGLIGAFFFYQKFYGTCLYFFTYLFNKRYQGHSLVRVVAIVGGTNGIWLVFPAIGLYVCLQLVMQGRFDLLWN